MAEERIEVHEFIRCPEGGCEGLCSVCHLNEDCPIHEPAAPEAAPRKDQYTPEMFSAARKRAHEDWVNDSPAEPRKDLVCEEGLRFTSWGRVPFDDPLRKRGDIVGRRTLADGRLEYLCHNEAMCEPYYLAVNRLPDGWQEKLNPKPSEPPAVPPAQETHKCVNCHESIERIDGIWTTKNSAFCVAGNCLHKPDPPAVPARPATPEEIEAQRDSAYRHGAMRGERQARPRRFQVQFKTAEQDWYRVDEFTTYGQAWRSVFIGESYKVMDLIGVRVVEVS